MEDNNIVESIDLNKDSKINNHELKFLLTRLVGNPIFVDSFFKTPENQKKLLINMLNPHMDNLRQMANDTTNSGIAAKGLLHYMEGNKDINPIEQKQRDHAQKYEEWLDNFFGPCTYDKNHPLSKPKDFICTALNTYYRLQKNGKMINFSSSIKG